MLAASSAVLALAGGFTFLAPDTAHGWLLALAVLSLVPTSVLTLASWLARRRLVRDRPPGARAAARRKRRARLDPVAGAPNPSLGQDVVRRVHSARRDAPLIRLSPWEQVPPDSDLGPHVDTEFHVLLADALDTAKYPYDEAVVRLGFDRPGIKVASIEGDRSSFRWTMKFDAHFRKLLDKELDLP